MSVLSQCFSIIIDRGISVPVQGKEVVDGLNAIARQYLYDRTFSASVRQWRRVLFYSGILSRIDHFKDGTGLI